MPTIHILNGPEKGKSYDLINGTIDIGRSPENDINMNDRSVSRKHLRIHREGNAYFIKDLQSTNGTYINEKRIDIAILSEGTEVRVGKCFLKLVRHHPEQQVEKITFDEQTPDFTVTSQLGGKG